MPPTEISGKKKHIIVSNTNIIIPLNLQKEYWRCM